MPGVALKNFDSQRFLRKARTEIEATRLPWWENGEEGGDRESGGSKFDCFAYVRWVRANIAQGADCPLRGKLDTIA